MEVDPVSRGILSIDACTIKSTDIFNSTYLKTLTHGDLTAEDRVNLIASNVVERLEGRWVDMLIYEKPFFMATRPMSFAVLLQQVTYLSKVINTAHPECFIMPYSVQECKRSVGAAGIIGKDPIREASLAHAELSRFLPAYYNTLDEHAVDSIVIAYTGLLGLR
jgi:hypothetical protein